jgi:hypothetical protein
MKFDEMGFEPFPAVFLVIRSAKPLETVSGQIRLVNHRAEAAVLMGSLRACERIQN